MKTNPKDILDPNVRMGYEVALKEYREEIALGTAILNVLDNRYEFAEEDYE